MTDQADSFAVFDFRFPDAALCFFIPSLFAVGED
jgi:hypothetical protein